MSEEQIDEPQTRVSINLSALQGQILIQLQRLLDMLAVSFVGLEKVDDSAYASFSPFFNLFPAQDQRLTRASAVAEAQRWYLCTAFRDAIEFLNVFLDQSRLLCALFPFAAQGKIQSDDYNRIFGTETQQFHRLGFPDKLKKLRQDFGVASKLEAHVLSINTVRNCLVHRLGIVTDRDVDANGELVLLWRTSDLVAQNSDGTQELSIMDDPEIQIVPGWTVIHRVIDKKKLFRKAERIDLSYRDNGYLPYADEFHYNPGGINRRVW